MRVHSEMEAVRLELTQRLTSEQEVSAKLRDELRAARLEGERIDELRVREKQEAEAAAAHALELHRASVSRVESKLAATSSLQSLEKERLKKELSDERALAQELVTDAKQETAAAKASTLEAREDALRWQRALTSSMGSAAGNAAAERQRSPYS